MFVDEIDIDAVFGDIDDAGLQRGVDAAERHMHDLGAIGGEDGVLGWGRLNANLQALDVNNPVDFLLAVHRAQAERGQPDHVRALHSLLDHRLDGIGNSRIGERFRQMVFRAEKEMQRHHAGLRRYRRGVGGRCDGEIDIAGFQQLQHLRFLAELRAGILIDQELALAQLLHLVGKEVGGDAVAGRVRLVIGEAVVLFLRVGAERNGCCGGAEQDAAQKRRNANDGHWISPYLLVSCPAVCRA